MNQPLPNPLKIKVAASLSADFFYTPTEAARLVRDHVFLVEDADPEDSPDDLACIIHCTVTGQLRAEGEL